jgi:hypothetical protein
MKRGALFLTLVALSFAAACSGGGSTTLPPPPPLGFSNSSLKGQYAFIMVGETNGDPIAPPIARIGTFTADGNGGISGGLELVSTASNGLQLLTFSTASNSYSISADGRGGLSLTNITGTTSFSITMISTSQGYISQTDGVTGTSGTIELQDASAFTQNGINGSFVFDTSGADPSGVPDSIVGQLSLNGGGVSAVFDENDGAVLSGAQTATGTYFLDATNGATSGVGQLNFGNFLYDFVIVNARKIHLIEVPGQGAAPGTFTVGTASAQTIPPTTNSAFTGSFAFLTSGVGTTTFDFKAGRFSADGSGGLNSITMDEKLLGDSVTQIPKGTLSAMTYTVDTSFPGSGRVTVSFLDSSNSKPYQFIAYMASAAQGVIQDNSPGIIADGTILAQTGAPFTNGSLAGDDAFNWTGQSQNNTTGVIAEEDFVGRVTLTSATSNNVTGAMDFSELNLVDPSKVGIHDSVLSGAGLAITGDGTNSSGRDTFVVKATNPNGGPSSTLKFTVYPVNETTMFVINTDTDHSTGGVFTRQVTPP